MSIARSPQADNRNTAPVHESLYDVPDQKWSWLPASFWSTLALAFLFGGLMFLVSSVLDWLILREHDSPRIAIEASDFLLGTVAAVLFFFFLRLQRERRAMLRRRVEVIAGMNHHVRNALQVISLSAFSSTDQEQLVVVRDSVNRIRWALRELLPKL